MNTIRPAAVAGMFYPERPARLRREVARFVRRAAAAQAANPAPVKAIIAPHAGYVYSGPVAGHAFARVACAGISRVVLLGPAHRVPVRGIAASPAAAFATPLGDVAVDTAAIRDVVAEFGFLDYSEPAHRMEHSLEVELPFLQYCFPGFRLLPFVVGDAAPEEVDALLEQLWGGDETLIVISSDLSHYLAYQAACEIDAFTSRQIRRLAAGPLTAAHACGYLPIRGLLRTAGRRGLACEVLDARNSGDAAGGRDRVVGYGAYAFHST